MARYSIINSDNQIGLSRSGQLDDFRCKAITKLKAVRDDVGDMPGSHRSKSKNPECATGRPISIKITNNQNRGISTNGLNQYLHGIFDPGQLLWRDELVQPQF